MICVIANIIIVWFSHVRVVFAGWHLSMADVCVCVCVHACVHVCASSHIYYMYVGLSVYKCAYFMGLDM